VVDALAAHVGDPAWHEVSLLTVGYLGIVQKRDEASECGGGGADRSGTWLAGGGRRTGREGGDRRGGPPA